MLSIRSTNCNNSSSPTFKRLSPFAIPISFNILIHNCVQSWKELAIVMSPIPQYSRSDILLSHHAIIIMSFPTSIKQSQPIRTKNILEIFPRSIRFWTSKIIIIHNDQKIMKKNPWIQGPILSQIHADISVNLFCYRIRVLDACLAFALIFIISYRSHNTIIIGSFPIHLNCSFEKISFLSNTIQDL